MTDFGELHQLGESTEVDMYKMVLLDTSPLFIHTPKLTFIYLEDS